MLREVQLAVIDQANAEGNLASLTLGELPETKDQIARAFVVHGDLHVVRFVSGRRGYRGYRYAFAARTVNRQGGCCSIP